MILVYSDSNIVDLEWLPKLNLGEYSLSHSFEEYRDTPADVKIAFTMHRLHCDHDVNCTAYHGFEDKINQLSAISSLVFTFESELHNFHWQIWEQCHHDNVYWILPGNVNDNESMSNHIIFWGDWFKTTTLLYKNLPDVLSTIQYNLPKAKFFDALLGSPKPHRDFVFNAVQQNNLQDKFIMTYGGKWDDNVFYAKDYFIWEPGVEVVGEQQAGTAGPVKYYGVHTGLSRVIPVSVFNDTAYSIVAETDHDNTLGFYSEKTAKPIIARRLFIAFTGYKFLEKLRKVGFQTFGNIIDESYDLIENDEERYAAAFEQAKRLCNLDQGYVYNMVQPALEHNYNHIMSTDWTQYAADQIQRVINSAQA
ncbi:hypothetical protein UFOVP112_270 [uncultured Caudovirales phage]|uniref:Uncharacterized protein n=1 Tax=uncultured Caudovirales phage TaxID=2100421 RepID=A0A6J5L6N7_9CAUD|nr:hypothetical protein UFOVP112_270 [uncultured Caudovirales phage]